MDIYIVKYMAAIHEFEWIYLYSTAFFMPRLSSSRSIHLHSGRNTSRNHILWDSKTAVDLNENLTSI